MLIKITTDSDAHECETCGVSWAEGGTVTIDGVEVLSRPASAHCYAGTDCSPADLLFMALVLSGHDVRVDGDLPHITCHDDEYHSGGE